MSFDLSHFPPYWLLPYPRPAGLSGDCRPDQGRMRELFVCGLHVDRFIGTLPPVYLQQLLQQEISIRADGDPL